MKEAIAWKAKLEAPAARTVIERPRLVQNSEPPSPKSRGIYILLGLLLGTSGAHNLYIGRYGRGVAQFFLGGLVTYMFIFDVFGWQAGIAGMLIWILMEVIGDKHDALGRRLDM